MAFSASPAWSAASSPSLGTADAASVFAATTVTNTGATTLSGNLDLYPGTSVTGFPPGIIGGTQNVAGPVGGPANVASNDVTAAYLQLLGAASTASVSSDLGGQSLSPGVYSSTSGLSLTGTVTLVGTASSVFIFQAVSTLITGPGSQVVLSGGVQACNVWWQIGSSATLGTTNAFVGNIMALTSISLGTGTSLNGRALARNGAVTLNGNAITTTPCAVAPTTTTTVAATTTTTVAATTTTTVAVTTTTTAAATTTTTTTTPPLVAAPVTGGGPLNPGTSSPVGPIVGLLGVLLGGGLLTFEGLRRIRARRS